MAVCEYCNNNRYFLPGMYSCAACRNEYNQDEIALAAERHAAGHSIKCSTSNMGSGICTCGKDKNENRC